MTYESGREFVNPYPYTATPQRVAQRLAALEERMQRSIATVGWFIIVTFLDSDDNPNPEDLPVPIAYTIGLTEKGLPELCMLGVHPDTLHALVNDVAARATTTGPFSHGQIVTELLESADAIIVEGPATGVIQPAIALKRYGPDAVRLQQIIWPDPQGRFPWQPGYNMPPAMQPTIGTA